LSVAVSLVWAYAVAVNAAIAAKQAKYVIVLVMPAATAEA
jgi:hypothetical protein